MSPNLSPEALARLKRIQFRMKYLVSDVFAGEYESAFKGRGMEFEEVRLYQPGDDIRLIDWNVTARTGQPHVKIFCEERELTLIFLVDVSHSMRFGSVRHLKGEIAAEVTALLAHAALKNNDKTGLIIFSDRVEHFIPPKKGRAHIWRVIRDILTYESRAPKTDLNLPLEFLNRIAKRKVVAFLVSDFWDFPDEGFERTLERTARYHDLIAVTIRDRREESFPAVGRVELQDAETGEQIVINSSDRDLAVRWGKTLRGLDERRETLFRRAGVDSLKIETDKPFIDAIVRFFRAREKRL